MSQAPCGPGAPIGIVGPIGPNGQGVPIGGGGTRINVNTQQPYGPPPDIHIRKTTSVGPLGNNGEVIRRYHVNQYSAPGSPPIQAQVNFQRF